ncbi:MAG: hypothetical protein CVU05_05815 [Bacteroidetes bacterium HGW-Bacteroidetes-21]|jgi:hypothetical protein|nr:MAG: hypothetical protein CVU05_05815 [Bacteroidetes bacterium HGW-Bacteroidetes-21]
MKKIIVLLGILLPSLQISSQTVKYSIVEKNPDLYKKTVLSIDLFDADLCVGATLGMGLRLETQVANFVPWVQYKFSYLDGNNSDFIDIKPAAGLHNQKLLEIGSTWFFKDKNTDCSVKVVLHSQSSSSTSRGVTTTTTYSKYVDVPSSKKSMLGVDFGLLRSMRSIELDHSLGEDDWQNPWWSYETPDGSLHVPIFDAGSDNGSTPQPAGSQWLPGTNYNSNTIFLGLRSRKVINTVINAEGWGKKFNKSITDFYFQLMYAPDSKLETMLDKNGKEWILVPNSKKMNRNLGWRIGLNYKRFNFLQATVELGYKPGPKIKLKGTLDNGFYLGIGMGFFIGTKHRFLSNSQAS